MSNLIQELDVKYNICADLEAYAAQLSIEPEQWKATISEHLCITIGAFKAQSDADKNTILQSETGFFGWLCKRTICKQEFRALAKSQEIFNSPEYLVLYSLAAKEICDSLGACLALLSAGHEEKNIYTTQLPMDGGGKVNVFSHSDKYMPHLFSYTEIARGTPDAHEWGDREVKGYLFADWFDTVSEHTLITCLNDSVTYEKIAGLRRAPKGHHEWLMVTTTKHLKKIKIPGIYLKKLITPTSDCKFNLPGDPPLPHRVHGGAGSGSFHIALRNEILGSTNFGHLMHNLFEFAKNYRADTLMAFLAQVPR